MSELNTVVYRCTRKEGMYLYVESTKDLSELPDALLKLTGELEQAMALVLHEDKKLARASAEQVLKAIQEQGFYLQSPPSQWEDEAMLEVRNKNTKLKSS